MKTLAALMLFVLMTAPALSAQEQTAPKPSFAGSWVLSAQTEGAPATFELVVDEKDGKFTGAFVTDHGEAPLEGAVTDGVLRLTGPEGMYFVLTAKLNEDGTLSGSLASEMGDATFTAKRRPSPRAGD